MQIFIKDTEIWRKQTGLTLCTIKGKGLPVICHTGIEWGQIVAVLILNVGARWRWVVNARPRPLYSR